ncbi:MAG: hypothetical protein GXO26_02635 [Crenarchaeota archaeon]|nr:hypothetical protein [Thermoproteota archaeon]
MGRRRKRKRLIVRPQKKLPKIFTCPNCGSVVVNVKQDKKKKKVKVICGNCGLEAEFELVEGLLPVDYYNKFVDLYYEGVIKPKKEEIVTLEQLSAESGTEESSEESIASLGSEEEYSYEESGEESSEEGESEEKE